MSFHTKKIHLGINLSVYLDGMWEHEIVVKVRGDGSWWAQHTAHHKEIWTLIWPVCKQALGSICAKGGVPGEGSLLEFHSGSFNSPGIRNSNLPVTGLILAERMIYFRFYSSYQIPAACIWLQSSEVIGYACVHSESTFVWFISSSDVWDTCSYLSWANIDLNSEKILHKAENVSHWEVRRSARLSHNLSSQVYHRFIISWIISMYISIYNIT